MTKNELNVLQYIKNYITSEGYSPTYREIQSYFQFSSIKSVQNYINQLESKGCLQRTPQGKRSLTLTPSSPLPPNETMQPFSKDVTSLPILGSVAAGMPLEKKEYNEFMDIPLQLVPKPEESFLLRVSGDSMIEAGIHDKDLLLIEACSYAENGTIVVASTQDEASTVKKIYYQENQIELRPANSSMSSQFYKGYEVSIKGRVIGLIRSYT